MKFRVVLVLSLCSIAAARVPAGPAAAGRLASIPGWFEPNRGQFAGEAAFVSRGAAGTLLIDPAGAAFQAAGRSLRLEWLGASRDGRLEGGAPLAARTSYWNGADARRWLRGVPHYGRVHRRALYPGVDLVYYVADSQVEFDLVVAPGADPRVIRFAFPGAGRPFVSAEGDLVFSNGMRQMRPVTFQQRAGARVPVDAAYRIAADGTVSFAVGDYDPLVPLTIDPVMNAGYLGGNRSETANAIAVDRQGNVWIAGSSASTVTLPPQYAPIQDAPKAGRDAFLAKLSPDGEGRLTLVYWTQLGGSGEDEATSVALDEQGFVYIGGSTGSIDFPRGGTALQESHGGETDAFVAKIRIEDSGLDALWFSQFYGGNGTDIAHGMAVDGQGTVYIGGYTNSDALPGASSGAVQCCRRGGYEGFLARIATSGAPSLLYGSFFGGTSTDVIRAVAVDAAGDIYLAGYTSSGDFPVTSDGFQTELRSGVDAFLVKIDPRRPLLDALIYGTFLGGGGLDNARALAFAPDGSLWVGGYTESKDFPITADAYSTGNSGASDIFLLRFDPTRLGSAQALAYSTYFGGGESDVLYSLAAGPGGRVALAGYTYSRDFPLSDPAAQGAQPLRGSEAFLTHLDTAQPQPQALLYSAVVSGNSLDVATGVAVTPAGDLFIAGYTQSADFPVTDGSAKLSPGGLSQSFVMDVRGAAPQPSAGR